MKTVAYLRVSTRSQDLANQKLAILEFSQKRRFPIDQFIESRISSRQSPLERRIDEMLGALQPGDRLLVSELSRLGRSLSQVIQIVETLVRRKIRFIAIKEAIEFDGKQDLRTKVMIALFGLFAEVERDLISERTKEGLAAAKAKGKRLGRPKGALGKSRLDGKEQDIRALLGKDVSKASIAKILDVSRSALFHFIQTRKGHGVQARRSIEERTASQGADASRVPERIEKRTLLSLLTTQPASVRLLGLPVRLVKVGAKPWVPGHQGLHLVFRLSCSRRSGIMPHAHSSAIRSRCQIESLLLHQQFSNPGSNVALVEAVAMSTALFEQLSRLYIANQSLIQATS